MEVGGEKPELFVKCTQHGRRDILQVLNDLIR
jgi:hypothetical protein